MKWRVIMWKEKKKKTQHSRCFLICTLAVLISWRRLKIHPWMKPGPLSQRLHPESRWLWVKPVSASTTATCRCIGSDFTSFLFLFFSSWIFLRAVCLKTHLTRLRPFGPFTHLSRHIFSFAITLSLKRRSREASFLFLSFSCRGRDGERGGARE